MFGTIPTNLAAYPLPGGDWNVVNRNSQNTYRVVFRGDEVVRITNSRGKNLRMSGSTAREVIRAVSARRSTRRLARS